MIDGMSDELLQSLMHFEQMLENVFDWSRYDTLGMVAAVYVDGSTAQARYRRFTPSKEISLDLGTYRIIDIAPIDQCRADPYRLIRSLACDQRKNPETVLPIIDRLSASGFVGFCVVESYVPDETSARYGNDEMVDPKKPCRFMTFQSALVTVGFIREMGDTEPILATPEISDDMPRPDCPSCKFCDLEYVVRYIMARS